MGLLENLCGDQKQYIRSGDDDSTDPIDFKDDVGRNFTFLWHTCRK